MGILDSIRGSGELQIDRELAVKRDMLEERVDEILKRYTKWLTSPVKLDLRVKYDEARNQLHTLTIDQRTINSFGARIKIYQENDKSFSGLFLTALLHKAYEQGHNDIHINTQHLKKDLDWIGALGGGEEGSPVRMTIEGNTGYGGGLGAKHSSFTFNGDVGRSCGSCAKHCHFIFMGDVGDGCGWKAEKSYYCCANLHLLF